MTEHTQQLLKTYIPMSEQSYLMLLSLLEPRHGYGIMQLVLDQTGGRVSLSPSTVYTVLYKMEQDGLIKVVAEVERRKIYEITDEGLNVLTNETQRIDSLSKAAKKLLKNRLTETSPQKGCVSL